MGLNDLTPKDIEARLARLKAADWDNDDTAEFCRELQSQFIERDSQVMGLINSGVQQVKRRTSKPEEVLLGFFAMGLVIGWELGEAKGQGDRKDLDELTRIFRAKPTEKAKDG